jgi:predicted RNase H-like nuclease
MVPVAGVDGCRGGWVVVTGDAAFVRPDFAAVLEALDSETIVAVDMPIGLYDEYVPRGRDPDRAARELLEDRWPTVFSAPVRRAFGAEKLTEAQARGCRMTIQALKIMPKVEQIDLLMTPVLQARVYEVHPEICFRELNGGRPVRSKKSRRPGREERRELLTCAGIGIPDRPRQGEKEDDLLDACAALWSARRLANGTAWRVPDPPPVDGRGLRMEICW